MLFLDCRLLVSSMMVLLFLASFRLMFQAALVFIARGSSLRLIALGLERDSRRESTNGTTAR